jgi:hypothetical protein
MERHTRRRLKGRRSSCRTISRIRRLAQMCIAFVQTAHAGQHKAVPVGYSTGFRSVQPMQKQSTSHRAALYRINDWHRSRTGRGWPPKYMTLSLINLLIANLPRPAPHVVLSPLPRSGRGVRLDRTLTWSTQCAQLRNLAMPSAKT